MRVKHIIFDLLEYLDEYSKENAGRTELLSTSDFISFLNIRHPHVSTQRNRISGGKNEAVFSPFASDKSATDISILVSLLFRHAKVYLKKALKDSRIQGPDEFSFLVTLLSHDTLSKKELIDIQVMEKTSGMEIINRLIKKGFAQQFQDENDRRSKIVQITEEGKKEIISVLPQMNLVSKIVAGNLTMQEQGILIHLMRKLDKFHNQIYMNEKDKDLETLLNKIKPVR